MLLLNQEFQKSAGKNLKWLLVVPLFLLVLASGCLSDQHSEFLGVIKRPRILPTSSEIHGVGGEFHYAEENISDTMTGFSFGESSIVFVHDSRAFARDHRILSKDISAVYFVEGFMDDDVRWKNFLRSDPAVRDQLEGMHRLMGLCEVKRWKSNVDFRIHLSMKSEEPDPFVMDGILSTYDSVGLHPLEAIGHVGYLLFGGPRVPK